MEKTTGIKLPTPFPKTLEIERTDSHIPSATAATANLTQNQNPKGQKPGFAYPSLPSGSSLDWKRLVYSLLQLIVNGM